MNAWWVYFWPACGLGLLCGVIAGLVAFRAPRVRVKAAPVEIATARSKWARRRVRAIAAGAVAAIVAAALWHGPLGAGNRLAKSVEHSAAQVLADNEAPNGVVAHIHHGPLTRQLILSGPSDDFQRTEAARLLSEIPGVSSAAWTRSPGMPLIAEGAIAAVVGFLFGLVLAYLVELRRRHNAQWNW
jgi:membrane associated rhomboid family serine protease